MQACGICRSDSIVVGNWYPCVTSLFISFRSMVGSVTADLWFPRAIASSRSDRRRLLFRRSRGYFAPSSRMVEMDGQSGLKRSRGFRTWDVLNSEP